MRRRVPLELVLGAHADALLARLRSPWPLLSVQDTPAPYVLAVLDRLVQRGRLKGPLRVLDAGRGLYRRTPDGDVPLVPFDESMLTSSLVRLAPGPASTDGEPFVITAPEAMLTSPQVTSKLAELAQSGVRSLILGTPAVHDPHLRPWIQTLSLTPPREQALRDLVRQLLPEQLADDDSVAEVAGTVRGLDVPSAIAVVEGSLRDRDWDTMLRPEDRAPWLAELRGERDRLLRQSTGVTVIPERATQDTVGGLRHLKRVLEYHGAAFRHRARARLAGVGLPRGILMVGLPGCGKSLSAKLAAHALGLPLLRLDMGSVMAGYVGESEANLRRAIGTAEATAPCVLWIDELDKAVGSLDGHGDSGTGQRMLGYLLTWMQDRHADVYVFATANDVERLPREVLRRGRFDELFRVGLPSPKERAEILRIHLGDKAEQLDSSALRDFAQKLDKYSGADIEALVRQARLRAFGGNQLLTLQTMEAVRGAFVPMAKQFEQRMTKLESQLAEHQFRDASADDNIPPPLADELHTTELHESLRALVDAKSPQSREFFGSHELTVSFEPGRTRLRVGRADAHDDESGWLPVTCTQRDGALVLTADEGTAGDSWLARTLADGEGIRIDARSGNHLECSYTFEGRPASASTARTGRDAGHGGRQDLPTDWHHEHRYMECLFELNGQMTRFELTEEAAQVERVDSRGDRTLVGQAKAVPIPRGWRLEGFQSVGKRSTKVKRMPPWLELFESDNGFMARSPNGTNPITVRA